MKAIRLLMLAVAVSALASCGTTNTVPITGRKQHLLVSDEKILSLSSQEYTNYMKTAKASTNAANTAMVKRVGQKLASAVESYLNANGMSSDVKNYQWEFNLVQDQNANAFCMPGGKIVVYEGLLPYTKDEASLAIVLGHEIAHAVAKHSAEQMSKQMQSQYGSQILSGVLSATGVGSGTAGVAQTVFGLGSKFSNLRYSRKNESEADYMGLVFAAMAGYDPNVAVSFWQRMSQGTQSSTPAFLSDHPSDAQRIADIQKELPEALKYYKAPASTATTTTKKTTTKKTSSTKKSSKSVSASSLYKSSSKKK